MLPYYLGIDVGSSKTHALIADAAGRCVGFGAAGAGNYQTVGYDGLARAMAAALAAATRMAGVSAPEIAGAGFGVAGHDWPADRPPHLEAIATLGLSCPFELVNDAVNGLLAGTTAGWGVNVTAGSSNNCRGRDRAGREGRIVGNGAPFGEYGGAAEIVARGLQAVNHAWIRRGPATALTDAYLAATGATDAMGLMEGLSFDRYHLRGELAVAVFRAADAGDAVAADIVRWAGEELGWLAVAVIRQLDLQDEPLEVVQSGSIFDGGARLSEAMAKVVLRHAPRARLVRLSTLPVVGAVLLGLLAAGQDAYTMREALVATLPSVLGAPSP
jgi:N-acetylglucosamine kinase-like BadF-type ATPase